MSKHGGNRQGYVSNEYYIERIQKLCGTKRLKYNFLNSLSCRQLTEIIWLLELAQIHALDEKKEVIK